MHDHPNQGPLSPAPRPGTPARRVQRAVLLELVTSPPANGDIVAVLPTQLDEPAAFVNAAIDALVAVGLAHLHRDRVSASAAALRVEDLGMIKP
jgi:hypothetical protein